MALLETAINRARGREDDNRQRDQRASKWRQPHIEASNGEKGVSFDPANAEGSNANMNWASTSCAELVIWVEDVLRLAHWTGCALFGAAHEPPNSLRKGATIMASDPQPRPRRSSR